MTSAIRAAIIEGRRRFHDVPITANCAFGGFSRAVIGTTRFSGMEMIREEVTPVWSMAYSGGMETGEVDIEEKAYVFLRKALVELVDHARLPETPSAKYVKGRWMYEYRHEPSSSSAYSFGRERVLYRGRYPTFEDAPDSIYKYQAFFIFTDIVDNRR